jgi:NADH-quinone oxidoreductase subunit E
MEDLKKENQINFNKAIDLEFPSELNDYILAKKDEKGSLIALLHRVQEHYGYIPRKAAMKLSQMIEIPLAKIYGVITFYHLFKLKKPGKYKIQVCTGTACYLTGAFDLIDELERVLCCGVNNTTADGLFSIEMVRCVGCCGLAPVIMIGEEVFGNLDKDDVSKIVEEFRNRREE